MSLSTAGLSAAIQAKIRAAFSSTSWSDPDLAALADAIAGAIVEYVVANAVVTTLDSHGDTGTGTVS